MEFTHLHTHSHFSLLDGLAKTDELIAKAKNLGMKSLALTDHGVMYGLIEFYQKAKEQGIKPIIGVEAYVARGSRHSKKPKIDIRPYHLILLAKNEKGYKNLIELTTKAHLEGFYYKPRIDLELLKQHSEGLIALSACIDGQIPRELLNQNFKKAKELALLFKDIFNGDFYLELQHHSKLKEQEIANERVIKLAKDLAIPLVATNDIHYLNQEDAQAHDVLLCIQTQKTILDKDRLSFPGDDYYMKSPDEMMKDFKYIPEAIKNTQKIANLCNLEIELGKIKLPYFKVPKEYTPESYLKELCYKGLIERYKQPKEQIEKTILDRLDYELSIIKKTGFATYFLIVQDFINYAKKQKIVVGPGRGSAAGSLVSYLLNITDLDPLKYDLLFERFLNPARISMPDIDTDFADNRRDEIINYIEKKYGKDYVAQIITFGTMAARAAVRDAGRAMGYPYAFCDKVAKLIPVFSNLNEALQNVPELKLIFDQEPKVQKLLNMAKKLEGVARHVSTHACGVVITKDKINNYIPRQFTSQDNKTIITQYSLHSIEDLGLLKIDILGLKNLNIIQNTLKIIEKTKGIKIDIKNIPLNEEKVFELLRNGNTTGVFQLESRGMKRYLKQLKPTKLEDIIAMVALFRPGPIEWIPNYIIRKHNPDKIKYIHPNLKPILEKTYGIAVYQEQIMEIAKHLAGFSLAEADILRKAVGKKIKKLLIQQRNKFIQGCINNGITKPIAEKIFSFMEPFAGYGFNRSHAACYAMIAYQTAYLKALFPVEFMTALLTADEENTDRVAIEVAECRQMGIKVLPPDINESLADFTAVASKAENGKINTIKFGLSAIKNVGKNIIKAVIEERKKNGLFKNLDDFIQRIQSKDLNKKSLESLIKCGSLDQFGERNQLLFNIDKILSYARNTYKALNSGQTDLFSANGSAHLAPKLKLKETKPVSKKEKLIWEKELLGLYISEHPTDEYKEYLRLHTVPCAHLTKSLVKKKIRVGGVISKIQKIITRSNQPMLFVQIEDSTSSIETLVFPSTLKQTMDIWQEDKIVLVEGILNDKDGTFKLLCNKAKELTPETMKRAYLME